MTNSSGHHKSSWKMFLGVLPQQVFILYLLILLSNFPYYCNYNFTHISFFISAFADCFPLDSRRQQVFHWILGDGTLSILDDLKKML